MQPKKEEKKKILYSDVRIDHNGCLYVGDRSGDCRRSVDTFISRMLKRKKVVAQYNVAYVRDKKGGVNGQWCTCVIITGQTFISDPFNSYLLFCAYWMPFTLTSSSIFWCGTKCPYTYFRWLKRSFFQCVQTHTVMYNDDCYKWEQKNGFNAKRRRVYRGPVCVCVCWGLDGMRRVANWNHMLRAA